MCSSPEQEAAFLIEEFKALRKEMDDSIGRLVDCERYALLSTAAIWSWLLAQKPALPAVLFWLPFLICLFFFVRGLGLILHINDLGKHFAKVETHFRVPTNLCFEKHYSEGYRCKVKVWTVWVFWPALLAVTFVLPFLRLNQAAEEKRKSLDHLTQEQQSSAAQDAIKSAQKTAEDAASIQLQGSVEDAQKRLSTINTRITNVENGIRDANSSITALSPQIERLKQQNVLATFSSLLLQVTATATSASADAARSAAQRATDAANATAALVANLEQRMQKQEQITPKQSTTRQGNLSLSQWKKIQGSLTAQGFNPGRIDGRLGPSTVNAIREYQKQRSDHPDVTGTLTDNQVDDLLK